MSGNRRLVIVVPWLQGGGAQAALRALLKRLQIGEVVLVICFENSSHVEDLADHVQNTVWLRESRSVAGAWRAARRLKSLLRANDVVYSLMRGSHVVLGLLPRKHFSQINLAASFHQLPSVDAVGLAAIAENHFVRRAVKRAQVVTAPSQRAIEELREMNIIEGHQGTLAQNLIDSSTLEPMSRSHLDGRPVHLLFAGRLTKQKGVDLIGDLLADVPREVHLTIAGEGPLVSAVEELLARDWQHTVSYLGYVADLTSEIDAADYLFLPSRFELNPVVIWEGWSRGRAAITSNAVAFRDLQAAGPLRIFESSAELQALLTEEAEPKDDFDRAVEAFDQANGSNPLLNALQEMIFDESR